MSNIADKKNRMNRRDFIKASAIASAAVAVPVIVPATVFGADAPSNRITMGCIGVGRMGMGDLREILGHKDVQVVATCDVDSNRAKYAAKTVEAKYGDGFKGCDTYGDFRKIVARKDIDAVMVCTPDHWHAIPAIAAAKAGKDIFLQKP